MGYDPSNPNFRVETIKGDFLNSPQNPSAIFDFYTATDVKYKNITFLRKIVNIAIQILGYHIAWIFHAFGNLVPRL